MKGCHGDKQSHLCGFSVLFHFKFQKILMSCTFPWQKHTKSMQSTYTDNKFMSNLGRMLRCIIEDSTYSHFLDLCYTLICSGTWSYHSTSFWGTKVMCILKCEYSKTLLHSYVVMWSWTSCTPMLVNFCHRLHVEDISHCAVVLKISWMQRLVKGIRLRVRAISCSFLSMHWTWEHTKATFKIWW